MTPIAHGTQKYTILRNIKLVDQWTQPLDQHLSHLAAEIEKSSKKAFNRYRGGSQQDLETRLTRNERRTQSVTAFAPENPRLSEPSVCGQSRPKTPDARRVSFVKRSRASRNSFCRPRSQAQEKRPVAIQKLRYLCQQAEEPGAVEEDEEDCLLSAGLANFTNQINQDILTQIDLKQRAITAFEQDLGPKSSVQDYIAKFESEVRKCQVAFNSVVKAAGE